MSTNNPGDCGHEQFSGPSSSPAAATAVVKEDRALICGWPTDTLEIDLLQQPRPITRRSSSYNAAVPRPPIDDDDDDGGDDAHTLILFVPGNPGVVHWYVDALVRIVERLGRGYAARGVSYAGHGVDEGAVGTNRDHEQSFHAEKLLHTDRHNDDSNETTSEDEAGNRPRRDMTVPWTMDGQIRHKMEWIDRVLENYYRKKKKKKKGRRRRRRSAAPSSSPHPNLVFLSHSIGAHFVQSLLIRRPDVLARTRHVVHLTPFFRFDPPTLPTRLFLSSGARHYKRTIPAMTAMTRAMSAALPRKLIDAYLEKAMGLDCTRGRQIALDVFMHPNMVRNHLVLGMQEIRELPELPNDVALRLIGDITPTSVLFCGCDHWAPKNHLKDLQGMQSQSEIPMNVHTEYIEELRHDFVVHPEMINPVVNFCVDRIENGGGSSSINIRSKL